jgi:hypothetical protein
MIRDKADLKEEKAEALEWETNAIKRAIQHLLKGELNNDNYRKKTPLQVKELTLAEFRARGILSEAKYAITANRLLRKLQASKSTADSIMVLGEYLLG